MCVNSVENGIVLLISGCKTYNKPSRSVSVHHVPSGRNSDLSPDGSHWLVSKRLIKLKLIIIIIIAEMAVFSVAGYLIEERRRWPVITASHGDNITNKFRILKGIFR